MAICSKMAVVPEGDLPHVSQDKDDGYMVTIQVPGRRLGLDGLSTVGADVQVGVWPAQQQAGQGTPHAGLEKHEPVVVVFIVAWW